MLRFNLNVSILLKEYPFLERLDHAARLGFDAVEFWWPAGEDLQKITQRLRDNQLSTVLFNFDGGEMAAGDRGLINDPSRRERFRRNVPQALEFAQSIGCHQINALIGRWRDDEPREAQRQQIAEELAWAADLAASAGVRLVLESLNSYDNGNCVLTSTAEALSLIEQVNKPNIAYLYDIYHMQRMEGNICDTIQRHLPQIAHIQIADSPKRHQPGTGELNFHNIFQCIDESDYTGSIGIEYNPLGPSEESLAWLPRECRRHTNSTALRKAL
jgi:hydroxypyruvate isomerase